MLRALVASLSLFVAVAVVPASAQDKPVKLPQTAPPSPTPVPPHCSDFRLNPDGTWSPVRRVTVGDVTLSDKAAFVPGTVVGGVDLARLLDQQCLQQP